ncbi:MAG TPA: MarR family transcriptional regulator [Pseudonocardiaceae bacterium]|nr:MarR family transcriptional regulator [Pseudonocardiaceae bacterium]
MRLHRRLRKERPDNGLSLTKLSVLGRIDRDGPATASTIAEAERIQPQSMTRVVAELEALGLIERLADQTDRRRVLLRPTDAGHALIDEDRRQRDEWLMVAMDQQLTAAERDILRVAATLLDQLAEA